MQLCYFFLEVVGYFIIRLECFTREDQLCTCLLYIYIKKILKMKDNTQTFYSVVFFSNFLFIISPET